MRFLVLALSVSALWSNAVGTQGVPNARSLVQGLSWMAGFWRQETSSRATIDEMWMPPDGEMMLGISRTSANGRAIEYEFMRIQSTSSGVAFFAKLPNQAETSFPMLKLDKQMVVFENPNHDFPQRVIYRIDGQTLVGRIEGTDKGKHAASITRCSVWPVREPATRVPGRILAVSAAASMADVRRWVSYDSIHRW